MVFISGEGGGAGSRLTQDVGSILAQLPDTVESLTGGGQAGVHQTALSGVSCTTISSILMASTSTISRDPRRVSVRLFVALLSHISKYITNLEVGASLNNLRGSPCFQALFHVFRLNLHSNSNFSIFTPPVCVIAFSRIFAHSPNAPSPVDITKGLERYFGDAGANGSGKANPKAVPTLGPRRPSVKA